MLMSYRWLGYTCIHCNRRSLEKRRQLCRNRNLGISGSCGWEYRHTDEQVVLLEVQGCIHPFVGQIKHFFLVIVVWKCFQNLS